MCNSLITFIFTPLSYTHTHLQTAQISGVLFQLKDNPQLLEDVLEKVAEQYTPDLCQLIRITLRRSFHQRPTAKEMVDLPFVQECLSFSNSALYKGPKNGRVITVHFYDCDQGLILTCFFVSPFSLLHLLVLLQMEQWKVYNVAFTKYFTACVLSRICNKQ